MKKENKEFIKDEIAYGSVTIMAIAATWFFWSAFLDWTGR